MNSFKTDRQRLYLAKREIARIAILEWLQELDPNGTYVDKIADQEPCGLWNFDDALSHAYEMNCEPWLSAKGVI